MELRIYNTVQNWSLSERVWFNAVWFQCTWLCCVLGREPWLFAGAAMLCLHFILVRDALAEMRKILPLALLGIAVDALLSVSGVFDFGSGVMVPLWLVVLWLAFSTTLTRSLAIFARYRWLAALIGGIGVPFNYGVGAKLGAVSLPLGTGVTAAILVPLWLVLLPSLYRLSLIHI